MTNPEPNSLSSENGTVVPFPKSDVPAVPAQPAAPPVPASNNPPAGWYDDGQGRQRWFDGNAWTDHFAPVAQQAVHSTGPMTSANLNVKREVSYVRQQQGHSIILHLFLGIFVLFINVIYITVSPNHYWHA